MRELLKRNGGHGLRAAGGRMLAAAAGIAVMSAGVAWPQSIARPVATMHLHKPQIISSPQFKAYASMVARQSGRDTLDQNQCRTVLNALVDEYLIEQEAAERRLVPTEAEVDQLLVERRRQVEGQLGLEQPLTDDAWGAVIQQRNSA